MSYIHDIPNGFACCRLQAAFQSVLHVRRSEIAEAAKLLENVYRAVNIALVNELKMVRSLSVVIWSRCSVADRTRTLQTACRQPRA